MTKKLVKTLLVAICIALIAPNTAFASQSPQENAKKLIAMKTISVDCLVKNITKLNSYYNEYMKI